MAAAALMSLLALLVGAIGLQAVALLWQPPDLETRQELVLVGMASTAGGIIGVVGVLVVVVSSVALLLGVGVWRRRPWAREGGLLIFTAFALMLIPTSIAGLGGGARDAEIGLVVGLADAAVVALLMARATSDDFSRMETVRRRAGVGAPRARRPPPVPLERDRPTA